MAMPCLVVFGEGNRGNVYNLLRQIATGHFVMVGNGRNRKSMAYVGNVVELLTRCLAFSPGTHVLNYADKPDLSVREIVTLARAQLHRANSLMSRFTLPYPMALALGWLADGVAAVSGHKLPLSSIRVRKFCAETTVSTRKLDGIGFVRPYSLEVGLRRTIAHEFGGTGAGSAPDTEMTPAGDTRLK